MMEKVDRYNTHLKKVLKTYRQSALTSLEGPNKVLASGSEPESATPPPAPRNPVPILSASDQSAELSETTIEGNRISCFIIGGEKRICFVQLLSTVLRNVAATTINTVCAELFINFSSCNSEQLLALKAKGLLPAETPTCGLVTKPDAERLCSVLLHEGGAPPEGLQKHKERSFLVEHECFNGARGMIYYELYNEKNWCVQCVVCKRLFTPQMFVCHSCFMDKKRNSIHTYIETGLCHWGFDSANWRLYIHVVEDQPNYERYNKIMEHFKIHHKRSDIIPLKRKQQTISPSREPCDLAKPKPPIDEVTIKGERLDEEEMERWHAKKKAKMANNVEDGQAPISPIPRYINSLNSYYTNLCENWVRNTAAAYHGPNPWQNYPPLPFTKDSKSFYFTEPVPAFLAQGPPVLLHPERVVPLSQSEQFERSFQPNVALAPPAKAVDNNVITYSKMKRSVIQAKAENGLSSPASENLVIYYSDANNSVKEEVKSRPTTPEDSALPAPASPRQSPLPIPSQDNGVNSVVEQVAAVLDALSDAEDAVRQRVINLVEQLTLKIDQSEIERQKYEDQISLLRGQMSQLQEDNAQLYYDNTELKRQLDLRMEIKPDPSSLLPTTTSIMSPPSPALTASSVNSVNIINASSSHPFTPASTYSNRATPLSVSKQSTHCSPVSVITSPPPIMPIEQSS